MRSFLIAVVAVTISAVAVAHADWFWAVVFGVIAIGYGLAAAGLPHVRDEDRW